MRQNYIKNKKNSFGWVPVKQTKTQKAVGYAKLLITLLLLIQLERSPPR